MHPDDRSLPESLTRLLVAPPPAARHRSAPAKPGAARADRHSAHAALESAFLRGFVYGVSGLVWLAVLVLFARHFAA
ncbi:hypothetical protein MKK69_24300 [Methylobacterium sp. J-026]|uniref:hypothetical protein n=1 Tax=Methylobacterium sp. J-026 TaxID=2836624 RepID=UPI001FB8C4F7|nr:hypothetical protein [Methylobacterium sp. J-026]MCJ2137124.1 hypothetical protein [Methylobacterium sp. J-026]